MAKFAHTPLGLTLISTTAWLLIRVLGRTVKLDAQGQEHIPTTPGIGALWHGRHFLLVDQYRRKFPGRKDICVMASRSKDGELLARVLQKFRYRVVRGSSSRGAVSGLIQLIDTMKEGYDTIVAVDGPRGPREIVKSGVVLLAQKTGYPIVPLTACAKKYWLIKSWDLYQIPKPFTKGIVVLGKPVYVPKDADKVELEVRRKAVEEELKRITRIADTYFK